MSLKKNLPSFTINEVPVTWEGGGYYVLDLNQAGVPIQWTRASTLAQIEECWNTAHPYQHINENDLITCVVCRRARGSFYARLAVTRVRDPIQPERYRYLCEEHSDNGRELEVRGVRYEPTAT